MWAMLGLGNAYSVWSVQGVDLLVALAATANWFLIATATIALLDLRGWRLWLLGATVAVTADRIANALGTGAGWLTIVSALVALVAIGTIAIATPRPT